MSKFDNLVDEFVYDSMLNYPNIFPTRAAVLTHALMVIGNGIDWVDGRLSAEKQYKSTKDALAALKLDIEDTKQEAIRRNVAFEQECESPVAEVIESITKRYTEMYAEQFKQQSEVIRTASHRACIKLQPGGCRGGHYEQQFGGYGNIFNLPLDIHPDWFDACYEMAEYVKDVNIYYQQVLSYFELIKEMKELNQAGKAWKAIYKKRMKAIYKECNGMYNERTRKQIVMLIKDE